MMHKLFHTLARVRQQRIHCVRPCIAHIDGQLRLRPSSACCQHRWCGCRSSARRLCNSLRRTQVDGRRIHVGALRRQQTRRTVELWVCLIPRVVACAVAKHFCRTAPLGATLHRGAAPVACEWGMVRWAFSNSNPGAGGQGHAENCGSGGCSCCCTAWISLHRSVYRTASTASAGRSHNCGCYKLPYTFRRRWGD